MGLVLYECLAGRVPFLGESDADTALARLQRDPTDLSRLRPTLPYGLADLVHQLLARNPQDRPASGGELKAKLARIASGADDPTTTSTPPSGSALITGPGDQRDTTNGFIRASSTPRQGTARPIKAPPPPARDRTPTSGSPRGVPAKQFQQRKTASIVVIGLLVVAALLVVGLWAALRDDSSSPSAPRTGAPIDTSAPTTLPTGLAELASVVDFDPDDPDLAGENSATVARVFDGDPNTFWATNCYSSKFFGGKVGVGLIAELSQPSLGTISMSMQNAPYQVDVYATTAATAPPSIEAWGVPIQQKQFSETPGVVSATLAVEPMHYVLFLLHEAGKGSDCTTKNPYRAQVSEITFTPKTP